MKLCQHTPIRLHSVVLNYTHGQNLFYVVSTEISTEIRFRTKQVQKQCRFHTHSSLALRGVRFQDTPSLAKSENSRMIDRRPQRHDILVFFFSLQKHSDRSCLFLTSSSLQLLEHHAAWFEVLFELPNNFDAPTDYRGRIINFYFLGGGGPANLRNRKVRTREN